MCLTFFRSFDSGSNYRFILAFNRDEGTLREALPFAAYVEDPNIYAGRDLTSTGTWLGLNIKTGLIVILTNYDTEEIVLRKSRGKLVYLFLNSTTFLQCKSQQEIDQKLIQLLHDIEVHQQQYTPFNLSIYNMRTNRIFYLNNRTKTKVRQLSKGTNYGLCNIDIDTLWDKTAYGLKIFGQIIERQKQREKQAKEQRPGLVLQLLDLMNDDKSFVEDPQRQSSIFVRPYFSKIQNRERRTKSTTIIILDDQLNIDVTEISHGESKTQVRSKLSLLQL